EAPLPAAGPREAVASPPAAGPRAAVASPPRGEPRPPVVRWAAAAGLARAGPSPAEAPRGPGTPAEPASLASQGRAARAPAGEPRGRGALQAGAERAATPVPP